MSQDEPGEAVHDDSTALLAFWQYLGSGYLNPGDVLLVAGVEASLQVAREALRDLRARPDRWPELPRVWAGEDNLGDGRAQPSTALKPAAM